MQNQLLASLPAADYDHLAPFFEYVELPRGTELGKRGEPIEHVYFLISGIGSVVATSPEGHKAEAGLFGNDGYIPTSAAAGVEICVHDTGMQADGAGYRLTFSDFQVLKQRRANFAVVVVRAIEPFAVQLAYTALSNAVHGVDERLARWLLMCHDRTSGNQITLTHEFISLMLAVRRPSVTTSLHVLEGNGFIRSERGVITIRNRTAMEEFAHDAYGRPEEEYRRLMKGIFH
jgi:CRP-like cAMP-binding protein